MHLLYAAVVRVEPLLGDCVADVGGVVSEHGESMVHHHGIQSVPALTLEQDTYVLVSYDKKKKKLNVRMTYRTEHHLCGKVWQERASCSLGEVKGLWEGDRAVELSGAAAAAAPKPFQVHAQDSRQGEHFESLRRTSGDV